jgi:hypothetical protein
MPRIQGKPRVEYPDQVYVLAASYYSVRGNFVSRLTLNNKGPHEMRPGVTLYARDGRRHTFPNISVAPTSFSTLDLRDLVAQAGAGFEDGSIRVTYLGQKLEMGAQVRMTDSARGIEFDEQLTYPNKSVSNRLDGLWWVPSEVAEARLVVSNTSGAEVDVRVQFFGATPGRMEVLHLGPWELKVLDFGGPGGFAGRAAGRFGAISVEYSGAPGAVLARGLIADLRSRYSAVVPFSDSGAAKTSSYHGAGVHVSPINRIKVDPIILARNIGTAPSRISGRLRVSGNGTDSTIELPSVTLAPQHTTSIGALAAWLEAARRTSQPTVGLEFEYTSAPGSIVMSAASVSRGLDQSFRIPLVDPGTTPSSTGGYFWEVDGGSSTVAFLKNVTDEPQFYAVQIRFAGGTYSPGLQEVAPHATVVVDPREMRDRRVPDAQGHIIPAGVASGQIHWSIKRKDQHGMIGRAEQVDLTTGVSSTYACQNSAGDIFDSCWVEPDCYDLGLGIGQDFIAWEQDYDIYNNPLDPLDVTVQLDWDTSNSNVVTVDGFGHVEGVGEGEASIQAAGFSFGFQGLCECEGEGAPLWVDPDACLAIAYAEPDYITLALMPASNGSSSNLPHLDPVYTWTSTFGTNANLEPCQIYEVITYDPTENPSPPMPAGDYPLTPEVMSGAKYSSFQDHHDFGPGGHLVSGGPSHDVSVVASQEFMFKCFLSGLTQFAHGTNRGPHNIVRTVEWSPFVFRITKHGSDAHCSINASTGYCQ